ncbi:hypothetical protein FACS1894142_4740 [Spirochaetia bacterium]|nr:hypothetical protein FACS1894142_4740 [Spirochaetia bacterium]
MDKYISKYGFKLIEDIKEDKLLPDPFMGPGGVRITSPGEWAKHREYLLDMLDYYLYGPMLPTPSSVTGKVISSEQLYGGAVISEEVELTCDSFSFKIRVQRPNKPGRFPAVCHCTISPWGLHLPAEWETLCEYEFVLVTINVNELAPDERAMAGPVYTAFPEYKGTSLMAWAWGIMRANDYLLQLDYIDGDKLAAAGCSRLGKQTLCTAVHDERIKVAGVFSACCGGTAALRIIGTTEGPTLDPSVCETLGYMMATFPYWLWRNMLPFGSNRPPYEIGYEYRLPFDMHFARALLAPRCVFDSMGTGDNWNNPYGDYGAHLATKEVYQFLGVPEDNLAYYYRPGGHGLTKDEYIAFLDFADYKLRGVKRPGLEKCNKHIFNADKKAFFNWERP